MTISALAERPAVPLRGNQEPRLRIVPPFVSTTGPEVVDLCSQFKLDLDPWQVLVESDALGELDDGQWAAQTVGLIVPRQNGKTEAIVARMLAGLFLLDEEEIIYSSHRADTSMKIFQRFVKLLRSSPDIRRQIEAKKVKVNNTHGQESVMLPTGQVVGFRTRAQEGGRGFSADCVIFDEAFEISDDLHAAVLPTILARPNPQVWYVGTPVDQLTHHNGVVFASVRDRGLNLEENTALFEWSVDADINKLDREVLDDHEVWAEANPSLGYRINERSIELLRRSFQHRPRKFATECLCVGDWPDTSDKAQSVIDLAKWNACEDPSSATQGLVAFAFDVTPGQSYASIACSGDRGDGLPHVEIVEHKPGTAWVAKRLKELKIHKPHMVLCDASGPASSILADVEKEIGEVHRVTAGEHAAAFGMFVNAVQEVEEGAEAGVLRHGPQPEIDSAIEGATTRPMGDGGLAWSRKNSEVDISPLVAATLALWGNSQKPKPVTTRFISLADALANADQQQ